jgi:hypothetical protein
MTAPRTFLILVTLVASAVAVEASKPAVVRVPNGDYVPDPKQGWFAGEVITISGTKYRWRYFTDDISHTPKPQEGLIKYFPDHIVLEGLKWEPKRIPGILDGVPVLWTEKGYAEWKRSGTITALYLEKK